MGQGGRLPGPTARGARIEGIEGVRGVGQLAEGDWEDWGRARARATVAGETRSRQFAVGHGRAERSRGRSPWRGQAGVLTSWRWARMVPRDRRQPPTGRHDGTEGRPGEWREGRRQEGGLLSPSNISRVQVHPPVPACIYIYMYVCMYVCMYRQIDRCTVTTVHCRTPAHGTGCIYISTGAVLHGLPAGPDIPQTSGHGRPYW